MRVTLLSIGKVKEGYLLQGIAEYQKRLTPFLKVGLTSLPDESLPPRAVSGLTEQVKNREGERILARIKEQDFVVALDINGEELSSPELAAFLGELQGQGMNHLVFVIGGTLGLSPLVLSRADRRLSLSRLTFPHQMVPLILLEQLYRAMKILRGEPYHY